MSDLIELLEINNVDVDSFSDELYDALILNTFIVFCREVDEDNAWGSIRDKYRQYGTGKRITKGLLQKYVGGVYREKDITRLHELIDARLRKRDFRKSYPEDVKQRLLEQQRGKCPICGKAIALVSSELDHIVPWSYVGDELKDNLQMLCRECNRRKSASIDYVVLSAVIRKS